MFATKMSSLESLDLDEEKAKRSILVTNVPGNIKDKDVIIYFQISSNGGGEVDSGVYLDPEHPSSVVITFDDPATVETAVSRRQIIKGNEVTVQRYPVKIPEIFSGVDAFVNPDVFGSESLLRNTLHHLERDIGITSFKSDRGYGISGSYLQITSCHKYILYEIYNNKAEQQKSSRSADNGTAAERDETRVTPRSPGQADEVKGIGAKVFQTVPIVLQYILTVPKHSERIQVIMSEFSVQIMGVEGDFKVVIRPLSGCTQDKHHDACDEYIDLYREICDGPMMSKNINLKPGTDSFYLSAEEAINEVMQRTPVAIQKTEEPDKWLFYGEETAVKSSIKDVCKKLQIDHPFGRNRKVTVRRTKHATLTLPPPTPDKYEGFSSGKKTSRKEEEEEEVCPICLDKFKIPKTLSKCNHTFCTLCIDQAFKHRKACPTCGMTYRVQTGNMPRGSMSQTLETRLRLPGYERYSTIKIDYYFPNGIQGPEHPNPGQRYTGTSRTAYLPDSPEGKEVLRLLKKAFDARLTFTIGMSVTTGATDVVTWNDIHHKTIPFGGTTGFGYPDPTYLKRVKAELAYKGII